MARLLRMIKQSTASCTTFCIMLKSMNVDCTKDMNTLGYHG